MVRYFLKLSYDGTSFHGWQKLKKFTSIQETIELHISRLIRRSVSIHGCGRTDAGVHAKTYFAHLDLETPETDQLVYRLNKIIPGAIIVEDLILVHPHAHAQKDAIDRTYQYHLHIEKNPFLQKISTWYPISLELSCLNGLTAPLVGEHDFAAFAKTPLRQKQTTCHIISAAWSQLSSNEYYFEIRGNHFIRGMIRILVANMLEVASGNLNVLGFTRALLHQEKLPHFKMAPPQGLHLIEVNYPYIMAS